MRYRWSVVNALLILVAASLVVGLVAFIPDVPPFLRVLAAVGVVAIVVTGAVFARWVVAKDRRRMALYAAVRGWEFRRGDEELVRRFRVYPFTPGIGGTAVNVLTGPYRFHTGTTFTYVIGRPVPQMYQVTFVELGARVPTFELLPEDLLATVARLTGGQDIVVGSPPFDDYWRVVSDDEDFVRRVLQPRLRRRLARRSTRGMPIAVDAGAVLTWRAGAAGMWGLSRRLDVLIDVAEAIPEDVWKRSARRSDR